ncbi:MAG: hypothetical protein L0Y71_17625, partial [Gemmataceae bacterium]|nr:hypothetical protein [Gemmataceae bacterium]
GNLKADEALKPGSAAGVWANRQRTGSVKGFAPLPGFARLPDRRIRQLRHDRAQFRRARMDFPRPDAYIDHNNFVRARNANRNVTPRVSRPP